MPTITDLSINLEREDALSIGLDSEETLSIEMLGTEAVMTNDYNKLNNHPSINGVELVGNNSLSDIGIGLVSSQEAIDIVDNAFNQIFG